MTDDTNTIGSARSGVPSGMGLGGSPNAGA